MEHQLVVGGAGRLARRAVTVAAVVVSVVLLLSCTSEVEQDPTSDAGSTSPSTVADTAGGQFDRAVTELREDIAAYRALVPGGMLLVRRGEERETFAWGLADTRTRTPMGLAAPFPIASITKTMVAVRVLQLVEDGQLRLGDSVETWLPGLVEGGDQITIEHLLSHRSGLAGPRELPRGWTLGLDWDRADLAHALRRRTDLGQPGGETDYSNVGYLVLGLVVEAVDAHPLPQQLARHVFAPAGMDRTSLYPTAARDPRLVHGYTGDGRDVTPRDLTGALAAGGAVSTLEDLDRFATALFEHRLLEADTIELMTASRGGFTTPGFPGEYGLGLWHWLFDCGPGLGHSGLMPGYSTGLFHHPEQGTTMVFVVNTEENFGAAELFGNDALCPQ